MSRIKIAPEQVRQMANQFRDASQQSQQMFSNLTNTVNGMQGEWEGMTQQRFFQEFEAWKNAMTQFIQLLDSVAQQLEATAARFEEIDAQS